MLEATLFCELLEHRKHRRAFPEIGPEENHRHRRLSIRPVIVLTRVLKNLLERPCASLRENHAARRDCEQPFLAHAVLEILCDVRREDVRLLVAVKPRRDAEASKLIFWRRRKRLANRD